MLEVLLDEGEPIENVPKSLADDGHTIVSMDKQDGFYKVVVRKK
jgi:TusA-related sulfurtransferase